MDTTVWLAETGGPVGIVAMVLWLIRDEFRLMKNELKDMNGRLGRIWDKLCKSKNS